MLYKVELRTPTGMLLELPLDDISNGFAVENIQGLDPGKATITSSPYAKKSGGRFQSSRRETRNILLLIGLEPDYVNHTVRDLRTQLYSYLMPENQIFLRFYDSDGLTVNIEGRVESFEIALFSQTPAVYVSILCFDPDFTALDSILISRNTVASSTEFLVEYDGTAETGINFVLNVDRSLTEFTIYHRGPDNVTTSLDVAATMASGDVVTINTVVGSKSITLLRASVLSSLMYAMPPESEWTTLKQGDNHLRVYATGAVIPFTIEYTPRYGGL